VGSISVTIHQLRELKLPPQGEGEFRSSSMLRSIDWSVGNISVTMHQLRELKRPPQGEGQFRSSSVLSSIVWQLVADVSV
jgi:hypothetical protein